jgi:hypothetical protein
MKKCIIGILIGGALSQIPSYLLKFEQYMEEQEINRTGYRSVKVLLSEFPECGEGINFDDGISRKEYLIIEEKYNKKSLNKLKSQVDNLVENDSVQ